MLSQLPAPGAEMAEGSLVMLYVTDGEPPDAQAYVLVPDVTGMSIVEASRQLRASNLNLQVDGSGLATGQRPAADTFVSPGSTVTVTFETR